MHCAVPEPVSTLFQEVRFESAPPNYRCTEEIDKQKNYLSIDKLIDRRRRLGLAEEYEVYEMTVPDETLKAEDILNHDDLDDPDDTAYS